jgi:methionine-rich copper-binding protein CopC
LFSEFIGRESYLQPSDHDHFPQIRALKKMSRSFPSSRSEESHFSGNLFVSEMIPFNPPTMRLLRFLSLVTAVLLAAAPTIWAHARLLRAAPATGAEVSAAPKQVELWFNELLEDGFNTVTIFPSAELDKAGKHSNLTKGKPAVDPKDHTHLVVPVGSLPPGEYVIEWRVLSRDGHSAPGRSTFRVRAS